MASACDAEKEVDRKIDLFQSSAEVLGVAGIISLRNPIAAVVLGTAAFVQKLRADSLKDDKEALDDACDLARAQAEQNPNGDGGTDGGSTDPGPAPSIVPRSGGLCSWHGTAEGVAVDTDGDGLPDDFRIGPVRWVCRPIVLDLDGDGVEYRTLDAPVLMDVHGDGRFDNAAWVSPDDGILIYDENGDGVAQHNEWVLTSFVHDAGTDLDALRAFDSDGNGLLNSRDELFAKVKIGRDLDQDGRLEAGEVRTLAEHGINRIRLSTGIQAVSSPDDPAETLPGVIVYNRGQFVRTDGSVGRFDLLVWSSPEQLALRSGKRRLRLKSGRRRPGGRQSHRPLLRRASARPTLPRDRGGRSAKGTPNPHRAKKSSPFPMNRLDSLIVFDQVISASARASASAGPHDRAWLMGQSSRSRTA